MICSFAPVWPKHRGDLPPFFLSLSFFLSLLCSIPLETLQTVFFFFLSLFSFLVRSSALFFSCYILLPGFADSCQPVVRRRQLLSVFLCVRARMFHTYFFFLFLFLVSLVTREFALCVCVCRLCSITAGTMLYGSITFCSFVLSLL